MPHSNNKENLFTTLRQGQIFLPCREVGGCVRLAIVRIIRTSAPVAQLDRVADFESEGWRFESSRARFVISWLLHCYVCTHNHSEPSFRALLVAVSQNSEWNLWLQYFLNGIARTLEDALSRTERINSLIQDWLEMIAGRKTKILFDVKLIFLPVAEFSPDAWQVFPR